MTLHARESVRSSLDDTVYAGQDLAKAAPKYRFPTDEWRAEDAFSVVADELMLDGNSRQNLATFCQTWEEPQVHQLMDLAIDKNMIDKDEYPQTAEIERRCVHMLADLWNAPESANTVGASAIGSSEACMLGGMAAKWRWRAKRAAAGKPADTSEHGVRTGAGRVAQVRQVLGHRDARSADVRRALRDGRRRHARPRRREHDHGRADVRRHLHRRVRARRSRSPPRSTNSQADTGLDVDIHVDGASGAFLAPFCAPDARLGLPAAAGEVDQHVGAQVRAGAARCRLDRVA